MQREMEWFDESKLTQKKIDTQFHCDLIYVWINKKLKSVRNTLSIVRYRVSYVWFNI